MVKLFSNDHTFHHPFSRVTSAFWRKYPNEFAPHIQAIDTYDRKIVNLSVDSLNSYPTASSSSSSPSSSSSSSSSSSVHPCLVSHRIIQVESSLPSWLSSMGVSNRGYVIETCVVNPRTSTMVVKSRNITGSSVMVVEETCTYKAAKEDANRTEYKQEAKITAFLPMFSGKFEQFSLSNMASKSQIGLQTIEKLCERIQHEGVLSLLNSPSVPTTPKQ